jgi:hypothetical protein
MNEEILNWKQAAKLWADDVAMEAKFRNSHIWHELTCGESMQFNSDIDYRRKPLPPAPDYTKDQGFKNGEIVMATDNLTNEFWSIGYYRSFRQGEHGGNHHVNGFKYWYARPLTREEYSKVRVQE